MPFVASCESINLALIRAEWPLWFTRRRKGAKRTGRNLQTALLSKNGGILRKLTLNRHIRRPRTNAKIARNRSAIAGYTKWQARGERAVMFGTYHEYYAVGKRYSSHFHPVALHTMRGLAFPPTS
jgi:hypothetical protein